MTETMRYLLGKLPNKMLVNIIIQNYESVFPDLQERKEAFHDMAVLIQTRDVFLGNRDLEKFKEPFRSEVAEFLKNWDSDGQSSSRSAAI